MEQLAYPAPGGAGQARRPDLAFTMSPAAAAAGPLSLDLPLADATQQFQSEYIQRQIEGLRGNMTAVAEKLGLHRSNLYRKMRQLGMETGES
jgi:Nif-specific regulatory protein